MVFCHERASKLLCKQIISVVGIVFFFIRHNDQGYFKKPKGNVLIFGINFLKCSLAFLIFFFFVLLHHPLVTDPLKYVAMI